MVRRLDLAQVFPRNYVACYLGNPVDFMANLQKTATIFLFSKFLHWVINSGLLLERKSIQFISYTYWVSLHKLWNFKFVHEILWNLKRIFKISVLFFRKYESIWVNWSFLVFINVLGCEYRRDRKSKTN